MSKFVNNCKNAHRYGQRFFNHLLTKHLFTTLVILAFVTGLVYWAVSRAPAAPETPPDWVWANQIGGTGADAARAVATDSAGNIYVTGSFEGTDVDFDPGSGETLLTSAGGTDIFVAKYDSNGDLDLTFTPFPIGGTQDDSGNGIAFDPSGSGSIYITGSFNSFGGTVDFDPGPGTTGLISTLGSADIFVAKYDSTGALLFAKRNGGSDLDAGNAVTFDASYIYITGFFTRNGNDATFCPGEGTQAIIPSDTTSRDIFTAIYDNTTYDCLGSIIAASTISASNDEEGLGIALDSSSNIYVSGYFFDSVTFDDPASITPLTIYSLGDGDAFVTKYLDVGSGANLTWAKAMGGNVGAADAAKGIGVDSADNVYVTGLFAGDATTPYTAFNWTETNGTPPDDFLTNTTVRSLAIFGTNLFAGTANDIFSEIFKSIDGGDTWTSTLATSEIQSFVLDGTNNNIFVGTGQSGVFLSTDNGTNWTDANGTPPNNLTNSNVQSLAISGTNLFAGTFGGGVFRSNDNGANWTNVGNISTGLTNANVQALATDGTNIFAGTLDGVFLSTNDGSNWTQVNGTPPNNLTNLTVRSLAISGTNLFAGTADGVFLSTNDGSSWTPVNNGLTNLSVQALATDGTDIFAGTNGSGVFKSIIPDPILIPNLDLVASSFATADVFAAKLDPADGSIVTSGWPKRMSAEAVELPSLALDEFDNVYVAGDFIGAGVDFLGELLTSGNSGSSRDTFVAKLDTDGVLQWLKQAGLNTGSASALDLSAVAEDELRVAGYFNDTVTFDDIDRTSLGGLDGFVTGLEFAPPNNAPVADAGPDQTVNESIEVTLDGLGSSDPESDLLTYSWTQTAGTTVTLTGADTVAPTFTAPSVSCSESPITFTFQLIVNDGEFNSAPSTSDVFVNRTRSCITASGSYARLPQPPTPPPLPPAPEKPKPEAPPPTECPLGQVLVEGVCGSPPGSVTLEELALLPEAVTLMKEEKEFAPGLGAPTGLAVILTPEVLDRERLLEERPSELLAPEGLRVVEAPTRLEIRPEEAVKFRPQPFQPQLLRPLQPVLEQVRPFVDFAFNFYRDLARKVVQNLNLQNIFPNIFSPQQNGFQPRDLRIEVK